MKTLKKILKYNMELFEKKKPLWITLENVWLWTNKRIIK